MARDLLVAAERYGLEKLRLMCQKILFENSDAMPILTIDRGRSGCEQFQTSCIDCPATSSPNTTAGAGAPIIVPSASIITHLEKLLVNKEWSDVTFLVEETQIYAHRLVIAARSAVLHEAVVSCKDNHDAVQINDMKAPIFKAILHFIYTDELPPMDDLLVVAAGDFVMVAGDMLMASCRFRLERMTTMCENLLAEFVTKGNVLSILKRARCYNCPKLEDYCTEFISLPRNIKDVIVRCIFVYVYFPTC
jgi:speckle-type POZ protein